MRFIEIIKYLVIYFFFLLDIFWMEIVVEITLSKQSLIGHKKYICKKFQLSLYCSSKFLCFKKNCCIYIYIVSYRPIENMNFPFESTWIFHLRAFTFSKQIFDRFRSFWIVVVFPTIYCNFQITSIKRVKKKNIFYIKKITKVLYDLKIE